jgi:uncharacterized membrane protein
MGAFLRRALGYAALGFVLLPVIVLFAVLILGFVTTPSCRAGTDSGGCAMGAAVYSAIPGAVLGVFLAAWRSFRR